MLVFFDARHPEPGAMQDTLDHLVSRTAVRTDASKFLYVLNQIDTAAEEDNPEDIIGAWQRALAAAGLSAGQFFTIYDEDAAVADQGPGAREAVPREARCRHGPDPRRGSTRSSCTATTGSCPSSKPMSKELEHDVLPRLTAARATAGGAGSAIIDLVALVLVLRRHRRAR